MRPMESLVRIIKEKGPKWKEFLSSPPNSIRINPHPDWADTYVLSYHMIDTKWSPDRPYLLACRGTMMEVSEVGVVGRVLAYGFDKFFNVHESHSAELDWNDTFVTEKLDGSLVKLFKRNGWTNWMLNNAPTADVPLPDTPLNDGQYPTFRSLIEAALNYDNFEVPDFSEGWTLLFELTSPYNRVVLNYPAPRLYLLGARKTVFPYNELGPEEAREVFSLGFETPKKYSSAGQGALEEFLKADLDDGSHEGVVVCDRNFNRVKMKVDSYLALHRLKDGDGQMSTKRLWECIQEGVDDDVVGQWPEYAEMVGRMRSSITDFKSKMKGGLIYFMDLISNSKGTEEKARKKEYARVLMESKYKPVSSVFFRVYDDPKMKFDIVLDEALRRFKTYEDFSEVLEKIR